jgi:glycosyltransferase involved in cell wall biosynthesis
MPEIDALRDTKATGPEPGEWRYTFTIFVPTYNRAWCLPRALQSIAESKFRDFEVIVVDDGSTDDTRELIEDWQEKVDFPLRYLYQENAGKAAAHNRAVAEARGFLFITVDSDDSLLPDALGELKRHWDGIPDAQKPGFAGIGGLLLEEDGTISGTRYPRDVVDSDYLEITSLGTIRGDKREAIRTGVLREFPYPTIEGENYLRPTMIFRRLAHQYKTRFVNVPLVLGRREADGISKNRRKTRARNPRGLRLVFLEEINLHDQYTMPRQQRRNHVRYIRFSLHSGVGLRQQFKEVKHKLYWMVSLPEGISGWLGDRLRQLIGPVSR